MKTRFATTLLIVGTLLAPVVAHAEDRDADRSHPKTWVKDSLITTRIKAKLAADHPGSMKHISVDTDKDKSSSVTYSDTPRAVQDTIKTHGGTADAKVRKHSDHGKTVYSVQIRKDGRDSKLKIAEDGTVIKDNAK